jgi:hypothetical protein
MMFEVYLVNFGYCLPVTYNTHEEAANAGRATGFHFTIREVK